MFRDIGHLVLDPSLSDGELRQTIYQYVPADKLQAAVEECERLVRPLDDSHFDFLAHRQNISRLVRGTLKPRLILGHWDDMLRVAGSLKLD